MIRNSFTNYFDLLLKFLSIAQKKEGNDAWLTHANTLINMKKWQALLDWCLKWTQSKPTDAIAWSILGDAYNRLNRYDEAILALYKSNNIDSNNATAWFTLGDAFSNLSRYDDAVWALNKSILIDPKNILAWRSLGIVYNRVKSFSSAIKAINNAIHIEPKDSIAWYILGNAQASSGNLSAAMCTARELRRLDAQKANDLFNLIETQRHSAR